MKRLNVVISIMVLLLIVGPVFAGPIVPSQIQVALLGKIFALEGRLQAKDDAELELGVYANSSDAISKKTQGEIVKIFGMMAGKLPGKAISAKSISSIDEIAGLDIVYVAPGCESDIAAIIALCAEHQVLGVSAVEEYANSGLALAIGIAGGKPKIIINKSAAEATGSKFVDQIAAIAKMI